MGSSKSTSLVISCISFFLNSEGQLESSELQAIVDEDQNLGTLIGLKNKLIVREMQGRRRRVLVPYGGVNISKHGSHVNVEVCTHKQTLPFRYFQYEIDAYLRQLRGMGDLVSKLYKLYLHALTTFVLPDPFTGCTGKEECLTGLLQAENMRPEALDSDAVSLLNLIGGLTPTRNYYPAHLQSMEYVKWKSQVPLWVLDDDYEAFSQESITHNNKFRGLFDESVTVKLVSRGSPHLLLRSRARNRFLSRVESGNERIESLQTGTYVSRDCGNDGFDTARWVSGLFKKWPSKHIAPQNIYDTISSFGTISLGSLFNVKSYSELLSFHLKSRWGSLFEDCLKSSREDAFQTSFFVCFVHDRTTAIPTALGEFDRLRTVCRPNEATRVARRWNL